MSDLSELHEALLRVICRAASHAPGVVVDAGAICREQNLNRAAFYAAVLALVDAGCLEYVGAGPRVSVTAPGALRCAELDGEPSLDALASRR